MPRGLIPKRMYLTPLPVASALKYSASSDNGVAAASDTATTLLGTRVVAATTLLETRAVADTVKL